MLSLCPILVETTFNHNFSLDIVPAKAPHQLQYRQKSTLSRTKRDRKGVMV